MYKKKKNPLGSAGFEPTTFCGVSYASHSTAEILEVLVIVVLVIVVLVIVVLVIVGLVIMLTVTVAVAVCFGGGWVVVWWSWLQCGSYCGDGGCSADCHSSCGPKCGNHHGCVFVCLWMVCLVC